MDFRLPQPLKYSLKKKKSQRKVMRKETGKLSLKNHNRNASCQTDSSESSELSSASSSKKSFRNNKGVKTTEQNDQNNEYFPRSVKHDQDPKICPSSIYHYCTPARRKVKESSHIHCPEANERNFNTPDSQIVSEDLSSLTEAAEMIKNNKKMSLPKLVEGEDVANHSDLLSDSDTDCVSESNGKEADYRDRQISGSASPHSVSSKILLESSQLNSEGFSSPNIPVESPREKLTKSFAFGKKVSKNVTPRFRSSILHKKFNRAAENDLAMACNNSDFYMRVKCRVLGLKQSISEEGNILDLEEKIDTHRGPKFCENELAEEDKENINRNSVENEKFSSFYHRVKRRTMIVPESDGSSADTCSPKPLIINNSATLTNSRVSENTKQIESQNSVLVLESSISTLKDSDSKIINQINCQVSPSITNFVMTGLQKKSKCVIPDSDASSDCESPKEGTISINSSDSDSSIVELHSDPYEAEEEVNASYNEVKPHSEERNHSREASWLFENGGHKSDSSELFRRVTKRALILDSYDSIDKSVEVQERICDTKNEGGVNLQFKPGFSTLSQSKHEDIKKWLNAIPCHPATDVFHAESGVNSGPNSKVCEDDNISLTEMENVLNELYGKDWREKKKPIPKIVPKTKESQIICERLTDSDDSSTPPLPASTPGKKKLYHHYNIFTPNENNCITPIQGKSIFTPLTSIGKKGENNTKKTPRTVGAKSRREKECLNSGAFSSPVLTFLSSLTVGHQSARCHPEAKYFVKNFKSKKDDLVQKLFEIFNKDVFSSKLPHDMPIIWNNRLRKTAGYCYNRRVKNSEGGFTRTSRVELSSKIVDNAARLRDTLIHELCHAATWIISEVTGGHGPSWKRWTNKAMTAFPDLPPISRCHNYDIVTKYKYQCTSCQYSIGRHSKSLNIQRKCCGICGGTFELFLNAKDETGKSVHRTPRVPNAFALFVKENYKAMRGSQNNLKHKDVMKLLSEKFSVAKISSAQPEK